jgi:hypothetical protein
LLFSIENKAGALPFIKQEKELQPKGTTFKTQQVGQESHMLQSYQQRDKN